MGLAYMFDSYNTNIIFINIRITYIMRKDYTNKIAFLSFFTDKIIVTYF